MGAAARMGSCTSLGVASHLRCCLQAVLAKDALVADSMLWQLDLNDGASM